MHVKFILSIHINFIAVICIDLWVSLVMLSILKYFIIYWQFLRLDFIDPPPQQDASEMCSLAENLTSCLVDFEELQQIQTKNCKWVVKTFESFIINWPKKC